MSSMLPKELSDMVKAGIKLRLGLGSTKKQEIEIDEAVNESLIQIENGEYIECNDAFWNKIRANIAKIARKNQCEEG